MIQGQKALISHEYGEASTRAGYSVVAEHDRIRSYAEGRIPMGGHQGKFITMSIDISVPGCANQSLSQGVLTLLSHGCGSFYQNTATQVRTHLSVPESGGPTLRSV